MVVRYIAQRVLLLWRFFGKLDLLWMLRDPSSFFIFFLSDLVSALGTMSATVLLAVEFHGIGRWTTEQLIFLVGYALLSCGLPSIFFNYNVAFISRRIGRGQLDHILLQPQPLWLTFLTEGFSPFSAFMDVLPGVLLIFWSLSHSVVLHVPCWPLVLLVNSIASTAIGVAFSFAIGSLAFWAPNAAEEVNHASWDVLTSISSFPLDGLGAVLRLGLLTAVPTGFLAWYPAQALLGFQQPYSWIVTPLVSLGFVLIATLIFRKGLSHYEQTGSSRYLALGHRR